MQRRSFLRHASLGAAGAALAAPVIAQDAPVVQWRCASGFPRTAQMISGAADQMARYVSEATDGGFTIHIHAPGEIAPAQGVLDAVQQGVADCGHSASCHYYDKDPALCFDGAVPFGLNTRQMSAWMRAGDGLELTRKVFDRYGVLNFPCGYTGTQMGGWFRYEIKSVENLKGLKFRTGAFAGAVLKRLGVLAQHTEPEGIRAALEAGSLDAAEWIGPYDDETLGLHHAARNYYFPGWWEGTLQISLYVNRAAHDALPRRYQSVLTQACATAGADMVARYDVENPAALRRLVSQGTQLKAFPKAVMDACYQEALALYAELAVADPLFAQLYDSMVAFRDAEIPWLRLAEGSYDAFMGTLPPRR